MGMLEMRRGDGDGWWTRVEFVMLTVFEGNEGARGYWVLGKKVKDVEGVEEKEEEK